jgi:hypothetical protein
MGASCSIQGNLGCESQSKRLRGGVIQFAISLVLAVVLLKLEVDPLYRLVLFLPFLMATNGVYQALYKT